MIGNTPPLTMSVRWGSRAKVEGRLAFDPEIDRSSDDTDAANEPVEIVAVRERRRRACSPSLRQPVGIQKRVIRTFVAGQ